MLERSEVLDADIVPEAIDLEAFFLRVRNDIGSDVEDAARAVWQEMCGSNQAFDELVILGRAKTRSQSARLLAIRAMSITPFMSPEPL